MGFIEQAVTFECAREQLFGVLSLPATPATHGVLIVVGGPQYRAGSHRQFTLLARDLAERGIASLRFDCRGMGDSSGCMQTFENAGPDIAAALDYFLASVPGIKKTAIWGLCDAASAALLYAHRDPRVNALALLNPWVRTEQGLAQAQLRHYYKSRLFQRSLWSKVFRGEVNVHRAVVSLFRTIGAAMLFRGTEVAPVPLPERMKQALQKFRGSLLIVLSGRDLTAQEFRDLLAQSHEWRTLIKNASATIFELPEADHTFSRRAWRNAVAAQTASWLRRE